MLYRCDWLFYLPCSKFRV
uniref:Uncharacterized protein n=1 Tax=Anguilla anguilla TaxID=7936 RepID=A0A0E9UP52_ANGAN